MWGGECGAACGAVMCSAVCGAVCGTACGAACGALTCGAVKSSICMRPRTALGAGGGGTVMTHSCWDMTGAVGHDRCSGA